MAATLVDATAMHQSCQGDRPDPDGRRPAALASRRTAKVADLAPGRHLLRGSGMPPLRYPRWQLIRKETAGPAPADIGSMH